MRKNTHDGLMRENWYESKAWLCYVIQPDCLEGLEEHKQLDFMFGEVV